MTTGPETPRLPERVPDRLTWWDSTWRVLVALALGTVLWLLVLSAVFSDEGRPPGDTHAFWVLVLDPAIGLLATGLMLLRRRWPVPVAVVTTLATAVSTTAVGAQSITLCSLATRRRWREIVPLALLTTAGGVVYARLFPFGETLPWWADTLIGALAAAVVVAVGYSIGSRRALVRAWVERARTVEAEQRARVAQARAAERTEIAREMHDVLAHRISLVTMHAGVLAYREDLPADERRATVAAIDGNARAALTDLREVLGVLRDPTTVTSDHAPPQADLGLLDELVEDARAGGTPVTLHDRPARPADRDGPPSTSSRTAYRVVQEGLTNARKHAPGAHVTVSVGGAPSRGLEVSVTNPRSVRDTGPSVPGAGVGLLGLTERVELAGGRLRHGWAGDEHRLVAWLPWPHE